MQRMPPRPKIPVIPADKGDRPAENVKGDAMKWTCAHKTQESWGPFFACCTGHLNSLLLWHQCWRPKIRFLSVSSSVTKFGSCTDWEPGGRANEHFKSLKSLTEYPTDQHPTVIQNTWKGPETHNRESITKFWIPPCFYEILMVKPILVTIRKALPLNEHSFHKKSVILV
jgi:hypothetical protein